MTLCYRSAVDCLTDCVMGAAWVVAARGSEWFGEIWVACAYLFTSACLVVLSHCVPCVWSLGTLARDFTCIFLPSVCPVTFLRIHSVKREQQNRKVISVDSGDSCTVLDGSRCSFDVAQFQ